MQESIKTRHHVRPAIEGMAREMFKNDEFNVGRLIALFSLCYLLNRVLPDNWAKYLGFALSSFLVEHLAVRVNNAGGYQKIFDSMLS